jgi:hypothetical protein
LDYLVINTAWYYSRFTCNNSFYLTVTLWMRYGHCSHLLKETPDAQDIQTTEHKTEANEKSGNSCAHPECEMAEQTVCRAWEVKLAKGKCIWVTFHPEKTKWVPIYFHLFSIPDEQIEAWRDDVIWSRPLKGNLTSFPSSGSSSRNQTKYSTFLDTVQNATK